MLKQLKSQRMLSHIAVATLLSLPISFSLGKNALAEDLVFKLTNRTNSTLSEFYASPTGVNDWEEDILGQDVLNVGEYTNITIADGRRTCLYDLKGVFADGESVVQYKINLCDTSSYDFFNQ